MNEEVYNKIVKTAKRALKIVKLLADGKTEQEVVEATGANRQLVHYYYLQLFGQD